MKPPKQGHSLLINHLNIRSLTNKFEEFKHIITTYNNDIFCLNETFLDASVTNSEINVDGYNILRNDRNRHGGGVAIYIKNSCKYKLREDITSKFHMIECIWIELQVQKSKSVLICSVYRAPSANSDYFNNIIDMITYASLENEQLVITGDLNYNYVFDENLHRNPLHFIETCFKVKRKYMIFKT